MNTYGPKSYRHIKLFGTEVSTKRENSNKHDCCNKTQGRTAVFSENTYTKSLDRDSSVGIETRYELDGPGIESRWGRHFPYPSRPALGSTQSPIPWVPGLSRG
jgi:hypothetical protein